MDVSWKLNVLINMFQARATQYLIIRTFEDSSSSTIYTQNFSNEASMILYSES